MLKSDQRVLSVDGGVEAAPTSLDATSIYLSVFSSIYLQISSPFFLIFFLFYPSALRKRDCGMKMKNVGRKMVGEGRRRVYKVCTPPPGAPPEGLRSGGEAAT